MKKLLVLISTIVIIVTIGITSFQMFAASNTWYVSASGSDSNSGTKNSPFKSISYAQSKASSGDTVYIRGGTYSSFNIDASDANYNYVHSITKNNITYEAYSGETPIFKFSNITTAKRVAAFHIVKGVTGVKFKGFQVTGVPVGSQKQSECFRIEGNATFDRMSCHDNKANGFYFTTRGSGSCTNCDSYNNIGVGNSIGNTDGFGAHAYGVEFKYCRAWNCSDDGFDSIASYSANTFDHCWAFDMRAGGDSNGFKVGGWGTSTPPSSVESSTVKYCIAANNAANGFYANHQPGQSATWTYNTAYKNSSSNYNMLERVSTTDATDIPGTREILHYNIAYSGTIIKNANLSSSKVSNNSWTISGVSVTSGDFESLDMNQLSKERKSDGSLPDITFMKPKSSSDLQNLGYTAGGTTTTTEATATATTSTSAPTTNTNSSSSNYIHNFTTSEKNSDFFDITGNLSTSKGTITYSDLTLTKCLKIESSTSIKFTTNESMTLTLVFNPDSSSNIKVDGEKHSLSNGILTLDLAAGSHEITKASVANLYYISLD